MLHVIPSIIARNHGFDLTLCSPTVYQEGRTVKVIWGNGEGDSFTFFSTGHWDVVREGGEYIEGKVTAPTRKEWVTRLERKGYEPTYAFAAWLEWRHIRTNRAHDY